MTAAEFAPAKLNLTLSVLGRRPDGYHLLDSLVAFADIGDRLIAEQADDLRCEVSGPFAGALGGDNLVLAAAQRLAAEAGVPARALLRLEKNLPVAAGIGGGSADAAAALRLLNRFWKIGWATERLATLGAALGADVPVCVHGRPMLMRGIGNELTPAPLLPSCGVLLANPNVPVATRDVFGLAKPSSDAADPLLVPAILDYTTLCTLVRIRGNDLAALALRLAPAIEPLLNTLRGLTQADVAGMSGSGATCFALFPTAEAAQEALATSDLLRKGTWAWAGRLL